jgi:hypothetical protein
LRYNVENIKNKRTKLEQIYSKGNINGTGLGIGFQFEMKNMFVYRIYVVVKQICKK